MDDARLVALCQRWQLEPDGEIISGAGGAVLPVRQNGDPLILKIAAPEEAGAGADLLEWWAGEGAVRVVARYGDAILMDRAGDALLDTDLSDDQAIQVVARVASRLHRSRGPAPPSLVPLGRWFAVLSEAGDPAAPVLDMLLAEARPQLPLHGDLHHGNMLQQNDDWVAIDPKGLWGERTADFAAFLLNPDAADERRVIARDARRLPDRIGRLARAANLDPDRLRRWMHVAASASALWHQQDGGDPTVARTLASLTADA